MADTTLQVILGGEPLHISFDESRIHVSTVNETIHVRNLDGGMRLTIKEERLEFSSPLVLAMPGWPFGPNPNRVEALARDVPTVVDRLVMPAYYRVAKWLVLVTDEANGLSVTSEIKCMRGKEAVHFLEYAILGDAGQLPYEVDVTEQGEVVELWITSRHADGPLTVRTTKIGIFN
ncbi:MAG: hypothetical protein HQM03_07875 [Magnetococcales bacterium]|nr:hypothetical protein [Magnetococcales bacterium]